MYDLSGARGPIYLELLSLSSLSIWLFSCVNRLFLQRIYRTQQYYTNVTKTNASDILTGRSIFAPNKCQTQFPFGKFCTYSNALKRCHICIQARSSSAAFHAFLQNSKREGKDNPLSLRIILKFKKAWDWPWKWSFQRLIMRRWKILYRFLMSIFAFSNSSCAFCAHWLRTLCVYICFCHISL